ncbi:hypothetical protein OUZ56_000361 [Daphnia magna]|uniref:Uncharacterized protein n=1 Tax=Daphnia magna TaxID=35525 RepID=A0ABQ9ZZG6_9CRUS|nr:hypothetical protein OUZ56_000361 [Daphnia magna]
MASVFEFRATRNSGPNAPMFLLFAVAGLKGLHALSYFNDLVRALSLRVSPADVFVYLLRKWTVVSSSRRELMVDPYSDDRIKKKKKEASL